MNSFAIILCLLLIVPFTCLGAVDAPFIEMSIPYSDEKYPDETFRYVLLPPKNVVAGRTYPLVFFLHGAGERGSDPEKLLVHLPPLMATEAYREKYPCYFIAPQCREDDYWARIHWRDLDAKMADEPGSMLKMAMAVLDKSLADLPIDRRRIYLTGLSMGGFGSWEWAIREPSRFAAVVPICGGGDPTLVKRIADLPLWAFHGADDPVVPVLHTRRMIEALRKVGGEPKYTEIPKVGHASWTPAYAESSGLFDWMFQQSRPAE